MKTKTISILIMGLLYINISLAQTHHDKYIHVADTIVNLADVDLEKGIVIQEKQFIKNTGVKRSINYYTRIKLFSSLNSNSYVLILDTISWSEGSWERDKQTVLQYFNENNELFFEKKFMGFELFKCYISASNEIIVISKVNEDYEGYDFYKSDGTLIKKYSTAEKLYVGPMHRNFFMRTSDESSKFNIFDHIDESGNINEMILPQGFLKGIEFSPHENYYNVSLDDDMLLYNINHKLIWRIPKDNMGAVNITWDEKMYMIYNYTNKAIEVKDLFNHKLIYSIDEVYYKNVTYPINRWDIIDSCFYTIGKTDSIYIYNFYNQNGKIIKVQTVPYVKRIKPYIVYRKQSELFIKPRKTKF